MAGPCTPVIQAALTSLASPILPQSSQFCLNPDSYAIFVELAWQ